MTNKAKHAAQRGRAKRKVAGWPSRFRASAESAPALKKQRERRPAAARGHFAQAKKSGATREGDAAKISYQINPAQVVGTL